MKKVEVSKLSGGIKIVFSNGVEKQNVVSMVQRCQSGKCDCMSDSAKKKIEGLQVSGEDGHVELDITGDLNVKEIEEAVSRSPLIND